MRSILLALFTLSLLCGFGMQEAAAKGFGRGFSSPRSNNSAFSFSRSKPASPAGVRPWQSSIRGAFGGLLLGSLISSLFFGNGVGTALFSWLIIGGILMFCVNTLRRQRESRPTRRT